MPPLPVFVFVVGTGSLGAEIAAVRLLAPYFGASTVVWANTIGVVLVALSIGYWLGGRIADRHPDARSLCRMTLLAAVLLALVPFAADPFLDLAVGALDSVSAGAFVGSLIGVLGLLAVPILLLGAVSPWAIRLAVNSVEQAGEVAGRLYALSTAGSLVGTLMSALVLIPAVGTRRTFLIFALAIALAMLIPIGTLKAQTGSGRVIHEADTEYQYARVIERDDGSRRLELNEGQAVHSLYRPETVLTGDYWDGLLVLPFLSRSEPPRRMAILGNAAGTTARAYGRFFPATRIDGVELDSELSEIGRRYFDMKNPRLTMQHEDARPYLRRVDAKYDVIEVDAYRQPYIPFYLTTEEFFELVRDRLTPDGVVIINVGQPEGETKLERVLTAGLRSQFAHVARDPIQDTNTLLVAGRSPLSPARLRAAIPSMPRGLRPTARAAADRVGRPLGGERAYTDDRAPVEWLVDKSIVDYAAEDD
jgi:spermidine synthase